MRNVTRYGSNSLDSVKKSQHPKRSAHSEHLFDNLSIFEVIMNGERSSPLQ